MRGFDDKALILFPKEENYINKPGMYKYQFKRAVDNLCKYLKSMGIEPHVFYTDDVARDIHHPDFKWVSTLSKTDNFFISKYCSLPGALTNTMLEFPTLYNDILSKDPGNPNMEPEERFELVLRHDSKAASKIIPTYKIVVHFEVKNKVKYKVKSKPGDGLIRITVSASTFIPTVELSGNVEHICDVLAVPYGNRAMDNWEV